MQNQTLNVSGMTCEGCASNVAKALKAIPGVHDEGLTSRPVRLRCATTSNGPRLIN